MPLFICINYFYYNSENAISKVHEACNWASKSKIKNILLKNKGDISKTIDDLCSNFNDEDDTEEENNSDNSDTNKDLECSKDRNYANKFSKLSICDMEQNKATIHI